MYKFLAKRRRVLNPVAWGVLVMLMLGVPSQPNYAQSDFFGLDASRKFLADQRQAVFQDGGDSIMGNREGSITLVEFFDYRCGYCKSFEPVLQKLIASEPQLRVVLKQFPILSEASVMAARAVLAARGQGDSKGGVGKGGVSKEGVGKDILLHERLMALKGGLTTSDILAAAQAVGLDLDRLQRDMKDPRIMRALAKTASLADGLGIRGTPGLVIGDKIIRGAVDEATLRQIITAAKVKASQTGT
ncbi:MAG: DsbA family protein [Candidatus Symbiobacter sp.]|nr:DsbA family protein [Candidatus Symbiobacter sp.]